MVLRVMTDAVLRCHTCQPGDASSDATAHVLRRARSSGSKLAVKTRKAQMTVRLPSYQTKLTWRDDQVLLLHQLPPQHSLTRPVGGGQRLPQVNPAEHRTHRAQVGDAGCIESHCGRVRRGAQRDVGCMWNVLSVLCRPLWEFTNITHVS